MIFGEKKMIIGNARVNPVFYPAKKLNELRTLSKAHISGLDTNDKYLNFARSQVAYLMGNNPLGQNYIVGFTPTSPKRPHHASSSCPISGDCDWADFSSAVWKIPRRTGGKFLLRIRIR